MVNDMCDPKRIRMCNRMCNSRFALLPICFQLKTTKAPLEAAGLISRIFSVRWWLRGLDLNQRPSGYEPDELPDCSTPRHRFMTSRDAKRADP